MITLDKQIQDVGDTIATNKTYYGLSTDSKPTTGVGNGSCFIEMNTGKVYWFNGEASAWIEAQ